MPEYPSDYYEPNDMSTPPPVNPCPDGTCCPSAVGPAPSVGGGSGADSGSPAGGSCSDGRCPAATSPFPIRYATGMLELVATDLVSQGFGESWGHTRTYGNRFFQNGVLGSSDEVNGRNWTISTAPYLAEVTSGSHEGTIAVMGNINATQWFDYVGSGASEYVNRFNGAETLEHDETEHLFRLFSEDGSVTEFHDFQQSSYPQGLFKKQISPGGQVIEVVSYSGGEIAQIQRSASVNGTTVTESLMYTYEWFGRLSEIILRRREGSGSWTDLQRVVFTYWSTYSNYWNGPDRGSGGDLRSAETFEWGDSAWKHTGTTYYTYYLQGEGNGFVFGLKHVLGPDAVARMVADGQAEFGDFPNAYYGYYGENYARTTLKVSPTASIATYADNTFEYDSQRRVSKETIQGGTRTYQYAYTISPHAEAPANWKTKTTETQPDGTELLVYSNADGEALLNVHHTAAGDWIEYAEYSEGRRTLKASPAAVISYDDSQPDLDVVLRTSDGLIELFDYSGPTDPIPSKLLAEHIQQGTAGTPIPLREIEYTSHTAQGTTVYPISKVTTYRNDNGTSAIETAFAYLWHTDTNRIQQQTVTLPAVPVSQNGSGTATSQTEQFDLYGNLLWSRDERGVITKQEFDAVLGVVTQRIEDVDTSIETDAPAGWSTLPGFGLNLITDYEYDQFGRVQRVLGPEHTIDIEGMAIPIRRAQWTAYLTNAFGQEIRQGQGYLKVADLTQTLINPVAIQEQTPQGRLLEEIQALQGWHSGSSGSSSSGLLEEVPVSVPGPVSPDEDAFPQESYVRWTTHQYAHCCQLISNRKYHSIPASGAGTSGTNYDQTSYDYDTMGRRNRVQTPGGTITFTVFDARGLEVETWVGTNDDGATEADPSGGGFEPANNMVVITEYQYDGGSAGGNGNLTQQTEYANATDTRVTTFQYDFRNRRTVIDGEIDFYQKDEYDNLNQLIQTERYDTNGTGNLISRNETKHDDRGRVYQTVVYGVDPSTGTAGNSLTSNTWYDAVGNEIKSLLAGSKLFTKSTYDGLGRQTAQYQGYDLDESTYAEAENVTGDTILEQSESTYDAASNLIQSTVRLRYHNAPASQTGELKNPSTSPKARVTYMALYSDSLGRDQASANYGTNGGSALSRANTVPACSDTILVTSQTYDNAGDLEITTDPAGMAVKMEYDAAGRQTANITNYQASGSLPESGGTCEASDDTNVTVRTAYNADGNVSSITAENAATGDQVTQYIYGTTLSDSDVASSLLKRKEIYPDSIDGSDVILFSYNRQLQQTSVTDQNGTVHRYDYDKLARMAQDRVTTVGTGVDGSVQRIVMTYEVRGMREALTSYDHPDVGSGNVVNEVRFAYNNFSQLITDYQAHGGAVNTSTSPKVQYGYVNGSDNTIRPATLTYPDGRVLTYDYGTASGMDDAASRIASLVDDDGSSTHLVDYSYLGMGSSAQSVDSPFGQGFVIADYTQPDTKWTLADLSGANDPDTGDIYSGLDRFDRVKDNRWYDYGSSADVDRLRYGYDRASNRIWRQNVVADALNEPFDELYGYDGSHRLKEMARGTLNAQKDGILNKSLGKCWSLDATGNWKKYLEDINGDGSWNLIQARTANTVNEITDISESTGPSWATPAYNRAGNMTMIPQPEDLAYSYTATYDAWNRLVKLENGSDLVAEYEYDGVKRRIVVKSYISDSLDETRHAYFTEPAKWQVIEERVGSSTDPETQYVWGLRYIDDLALRDRDTNSSGTIDERLYSMQDANWNVTALADTAGYVQERFAYLPYGESLELNPDFTDYSGGHLEWTVRFTGRELDLATGLQINRNRYLSQQLGCWISRDPIGYVDGENLYAAYFLPGGVDPTGNVFGQVYGVWCGYSRRGPGAPWDALDAACKYHDYCLATFKKVFNNLCLIDLCNEKLCAAAKRAVNSTCSKDYPGKGPAMTKARKACMLYAFKILFVCTLQFPQKLITPAGPHFTDWPDNDGDYIPDVIQKKPKNKT